MCCVRCACYLQRLIVQEPQAPMDLTNWNLKRIIARTQASPPKWFFM